MQNDWRERLATALKADGRSFNLISKEAGLGRNYVRELVVEGKEPGVDHLMALLNELGTAAMLKVIANYEISPDDAALFEAVLSLDPDLKQQAREFFVSLQAPARKRAR